MRAEQLDHVALGVADINAPTPFCTRVVTPIATGGRDAARSLHIRDPHRNLIEIAVYETG